MNRPDSAQIVSALGMAVGYFATNYDRLSAAMCALVATGYTLWKWRRAARAAALETEKNTP